jgi:hypothetical protein
VDNLDCAFGNAAEIGNIALGTIRCLALAPPRWRSCLYPGARTFGRRRALGFDVGWVGAPHTVHRQKTNQRGYAGGRHRARERPRHHGEPHQGAGVTHEGLVRAGPRALGSNSELCVWLPT